VLAVVGAAIVVAGPAGGCGGDEEAAGPDPAGLIAYDSLQATYDIYVMNADGTGERRLTDKDVAEYDPALSPDGSKVAYIAEEHGSQLFVMNADGSNRRALSRPRVTWLAKDPAWSPDGRRIAFTSSQPPGIFVVNADGTGIRRLTRNYPEDPAWSPDGMRLAFATHAGIHVVNSDGSGLRLLTRREWARSPTWSPDGRTIVFEQLLIPEDEVYLDYPDAEIWVIDADGGGLRRLLPRRAKTSQGRPVWSPDGRWFAVMAHRYSGYYEPSCTWIQVVNTDGSDPRRLTRCASESRSPHSTVDNPSWAIPAEERGSER
jgi:TolB protein